MPPRVLGRAGERGHQHVAVVGALDQVGRRRPERAGDQPDVVGEGHVEQRLVSLGRDVEAAGRRPGLLGARRYAVARQYVVDERAVLLGQRRDQLQHVVLQAVVRPVEGQLRALALERGRDPPCDAAFVAHAHDERFLALEQTHRRESSQMSSLGVA